MIDDRAVQLEKISHVAAVCMIRSGVPSDCSEKGPPPLHLRKVTAPLTLCKDKNHVRLCSRPQVSFANFSFPFFVDMSYGLVMMRPREAMSERPERYAGHRPLIK